MATKRQLESKLTVQQRKVALMLVENDLEAAGFERLTQEQIAEECNTTRNTIYRWRTQDKNFIDYMNLIADEYFEAKRSYAYKQLLKTISGEQPSIKGLDLYFKRFGLLTEKREVEINDVSRTNSDLSKSLEELDDLINSEEE